MKKQLALSLLCGTFLATGCVTAIKSDKIITVKERLFGISVGQSPATQTPEVRLGFGSIVYMMIPTSTNVINTPRFADTFNIDQGLNPFGFKVIENTGAGDVAIGTNATSTAIVPKAARPPLPPTPIR